jgi:hypothetical protein
MTMKGDRAMFGDMATFMRQGWCEMGGARGLWVVVMALAGSGCAVDTEVEPSHGRAVVEAPTGAGGLAWVGYDGGDGTVIVIEKDPWGTETGRWLRVSPGEYGGEFIIDAATSPDNWFWWETDQESNVLVASDAPPDPDSLMSMLDELGASFEGPGEDPSGDYCESCVGGSWLGDKLFGTRMARAITTCSYAGSLLLGCIVTAVVAPPVGVAVCTGVTTPLAITGFACGMALGQL